MGCALYLAEDVVSESLQRLRDDGCLPSFGYVLIGHWPGSRSPGIRLRLESWRRSGKGEEMLEMSSNE